MDHFSDKLTQIFQSKGGVKGQKIKCILAMTDSCDDINIRRECILRSLVVYVNEDPDVFFKEYLDAERDIATTVMGTYTIRRDGHEEPEDVGVVIEGIKVLSNVGSVIMGFIMLFIMLFGLIYALDLAFPENLKYTFEFFQKIIMNLDGHKLNAKIQQLKIKLFS
ncbi:uncharacterized protein LOC118323887 isoform X2 [Morone saxatilis]|nr:uncharacterized protein LOC118323887 isoform X2 [Morone saxatilis]XP_035511841.1 uncharacterized protein LOC118323887 isoform X2 [Morone saxatilis]XP_035511842.1 uncharacterized protein LOC118323887 isoform X2 [Morone saxatilis]XP_035511843.1 uncharacterized protein LOC118323887 isoform X2 [Morone saxatilis]